MNLRNSHYAGLLKRTIAFIIDAAIVVFVSTLISMLTLWFIDLFNQLNHVNLSYLIVSISSIWFFLTYILYFSILESSAWQVTLGKKLVGIFVCNLNGEQIGFYRSVVRNLVKLGNMIFFPLILLILFSTKKQGIHDLIANTIVRNM